MSEADFNEFWTAYPRKVGKADAEINYGLALRGKLPRQRKLNREPATHREIMDGLGRYKHDKPDWCGWMHGSTFFSKLRWEDEGGSDEVERTPCDGTWELEFKRREHEAGRYMYPSLATKHGWAEFGSVRPELKVVG